MMNMFEIKEDRKEETVTKSVRMPVRVVVQLQKLADKHNISLSKIIVQCCEFALKNLKDENV